MSNLDTNVLLANSLVVRTCELGHRAACLSETLLGRAQTNFSAEHLWWLVVDDPLNGQRNVFLHECGAHSFVFIWQSIANIHQVVNNLLLSRVLLQVLVNSGNYQLAQTAEFTGLLGLQFRNRKGLDGLVLVFNGEGLDGLVVNREGLDGLFIDGEGLDGLFINGEDLDGPVLVLNREGLDGFVIYREGLNGLFIKGESLNRSFHVVD